MESVLDDSNVVSYLSAPTKVVWTTSIKKSAHLLEASVERLQAFLRVNLAGADASHLGISQMKKLDLQRHCFSIVFRKKIPRSFWQCVSPYGSLTRNELLAIATSVLSEAEYDRVLENRPKKGDLVNVLVQAHEDGTLIGVHAVWTDALERMRRTVTVECLETLHSCLGPNLFLQEAKNFLWWARADACSFDSAVALSERIEWLTDLKDRFAKGVALSKVIDPIVRYLKRHILPFLVYRPGLVPFRLVTYENMKIHEQLRAFGVAEEKAKVVGGDDDDDVTTFKEARDWFFQQDLLSENCMNGLRAPQQEALSKLKEALKGQVADERSGLSSSMDQYRALSHLRIWFEEFLQSTYKGLPMSDEELDEGKEYRKALSSSCLQPKKEALLIILPTGVGKSMVMCLAPFVYRARRVLVVSPNVHIRDQLADSFTNGYSKISKNSPRVAMEFDSMSEMDDVADVYVCNIQRLQGERLLRGFPRDFFDLVIFDEAHHAESFSYRVLRDHFHEASYLLLTATPHRTDGAAIQAREIYSCSMASAIAAKYIQNVCYMPVPVAEARLIGNAKNKNSKVKGEQLADMSDKLYWAVRNSDGCKNAVIQTAVEKLRELRAQNQVHHRIIVQASDQSEALDVATLWRAHPDNVDAVGVPLVVKVVSSRHSEAANAHVLEDLSWDRIDVIVHVGMLGEGFDHPQLSICCIFRRFGSFSPYAQFVGRVLRRIPNVGDEDNRAYVIAHPALGLAVHWKMYTKEEFVPDNDELKRGRASGLWKDVVILEKDIVPKEYWFSSISETDPVTCDDSSREDISKVESLVVEKKIDEDDTIVEAKIASIEELGPRAEAVVKLIESNLEIGDLAKVQERSVEEI